MARMFMNTQGFIMCEEATLVQDDALGARVKLTRPLKLMPAQGSVNLKPMFIKEEWITIDKQDLGIELEVGQELEGAYNTAKIEVFSGIVMANAKPEGIVKL